MLARGWARLGAVLAALVNWPLFKPAVFVACLVPGALLGYDMWRFFVVGDFEALGVDPNITVMHSTGQTALAILIASLAVTPLRRVFQINRLQNVRRMLGVWAFTYAILHLSGYMIFEQLCYSFETCDVDAIVDDVLKRRFIFMGMASFSILLAMAVTSTKGWQRRLRRNWQRLHRLVYVAVIAAVVHFIWIQKSDYGEPLRWAIPVGVLLGARVYFTAQRRAAARARAAVTR